MAPWNVLLGIGLGFLQAEAVSKLPAGAPPLQPTDPQFMQFMQEIGSKAGTHAVTDVFIYLSIATVLVFALSFVLPSRQSMVTQQAELVAAGKQPVAVHMG